MSRKWCVLKIHMWVWFVLKCFYSCMCIRWHWHCSELLWICNQPCSGSWCFALECVEPCDGQKSEECYSVWKGNQTFLGLCQILFSNPVNMQCSPHWLIVALSSWISKACGLRCISNFPLNNSWFQCTPAFWTSLIYPTNVFRQNCGSLSSSHRLCLAETHI